MLKNLKAIRDLNEFSDRTSVFECVKYSHRNKAKVGVRYRIAEAMKYSNCTMITLIPNDWSKKGPVHRDRVLVSMSLSDFRLNFKAVKMVPCPCCGSTVQNDRVKS